MLLPPARHSRSPGRHRGGNPGTGQDARVRGAAPIGQPLDHPQSTSALRQPYVLGKPEVFAEHVGDRAAVDDLALDGQRSTDVEDA
jgi:hypothetical protein